jgi:hypothetical protein
MGQGGNVWEWEETSSNLLNNFNSTSRGVRGGFWESSSDILLASYRNVSSPTQQLSSLGFRVASIPEPDGDFNHDGFVDAADYVAWRKTDGTAVGYNSWRAHFGEIVGGDSSIATNAVVPEPAAFFLILPAILFHPTLRRVTHRALC